MVLVVVVVLLLKMMVLVLVLTMSMLDHVFHAQNTLQWTLDQRAGVQGSVSQSVKNIKHGGHKPHKSVSSSEGEG